MEGEHKQGPGTESTDKFVTGNYGVETTSKAEWLFVADDTASPQDAGLTHWPVESTELLLDREKCRRRQTRSALSKKIQVHNEKLRMAKQTEAVKEEIIAACLYTGPLFVKYNGVLRGLQSESSFLRKTVVQLCCPKSVYEDHDGELLTFDQAKRSLNKYTTSIHGINSAVIKLGKLTKATKVFRGISGMALPKEFWKENAFGVKGGVEPAFMSTTLERNVAMGYAEGDRSRMGVVIEVQQGMVNRGACISWLSQYPHEQEYLFGPLTGIEVLRTRVNGSVVIIESAFSVNLTALTLEQVFGKQRKVVEDMCEQLFSKAIQQAHLVDEWTLLAAKGFLEQRLMVLAKEEAVYYNENTSLGMAIGEAVAIVEIIAGWPAGLQALSKVAERGDDGIVAIEQLIQSKGLLPLKVKLGSGSIEAVHGLCALLWVRQAPMTLDLSECQLGAKGLAALGRALSPVLTSLNLRASNLANNGGDKTGLQQLFVKRGASKLTELNLAQNNLESEAAKIVSEALKLGNSAALTECTLIKNNLDVDSATMLAKIGTEKRIMLSGMKRDQTEADFSGQGLGAADGILIASDLPFITAALTSLSLFNNSIGSNGAKALADALASGRTAITNLDLSLNQLDAEAGKALAEALQSGTTAIIELNLGYNEIGPTGAKAIAESLQSGTTGLTSLDLFDNSIGVEGAKRLRQIDAWRTDFGSVLLDATARILGVDIYSRWPNREAQLLCGVRQLEHDINTNRWVRRKMTQAQVATRLHRPTVTPMVVIEYNGTNHFSARVPHCRQPYTAPGWMVAA